MAAWLLGYFNRPGLADKTVCLAAEDRGIIAASLLAALAGGPVLLLPYGFSGRILAGIQQVTGYTTAISDRERDFPAGVEVVCPQPGNGRQPLPQTAITPDSVMVKMYTGGTTGRPQFWNKTAGNLFFESFYLARRLAVTEQDCIVATVSPYHIYGLLFSVLLPLVASASVLSATPSFPEEIVETLQAQRGTILVSVPAHYTALQGKKTSAGSLRLAVSSAGMLAVESNRDFTGRNLVELLEIYGSTETGGIAGRNRFRGEDHFTFFPAITWKQIGQRLAVRSPFISPDVVTDEQGFFLTGDNVTPRGERTFSLLGRVDHITKVGGKRVNLEEIRTAIKRQPGVIDGIALSLPAAGGREHQIVALVQGDCQPEAIRTALTAALEPHALPRLVKIVAKIPLAANGKYDREEILRLFL